MSKTDVLIICMHMLQEKASQNSLITEVNKHSLLLQNLAALISLGNLFYSSEATAQKALFHTYIDSSSESGSTLGRTSSGDSYEKSTQPISPKKFLVMAALPTEAFPPLSALLSRECGCCHRLTC